MALTHRPVDTNDIPRICGFPQDEEELFYLFPQADYPLAPRQLAEAIARRSDSIVVEMDGQVVAFANFYRWGNGACCSIGNVMTAPEARNCGVGHYLIRNMVDTALTKYRASDVTVSCFNGNIKGLLLYTTLGFVPYAIEERKDRQGNRVALIHMRLQGITS